MTRAPKTRRDGLPLRDTVDDLEFREKPLAALVDFMNRHQANLFARKVRVPFRDITLPDLSQGVVGCLVRAERLCVVTTRRK